jgi:DNA-binding FadR family transcriptional regulator
LKKRIHDGLARDLGMAIVAGQYLPGENIPGEIAASQELKVSRNVYREAIRILAAKGLVESRQKAGTLVTPRDRWNLLDPEVISWILAQDGESNFRDLLFELRMIIEPAAAALAATRRSDHDLAAMNNALTEMRADTPDSHESEQADERFHEAILTAGRNEIIARLATIVAASVSFVSEFKRTQHVERDSWPDHKELFEAINRGEADEAHAAMARLIAHARHDVDPVSTGNLVDIPAPALLTPSLIA